MRTRDIRPVEEVNSIWDDIQRGHMRMVNTDGNFAEGEQGETDDIRKLYNQAGSLEDAILFAEEVSEDNRVTLYKGKTNDLEKFVTSGPDVSRSLRVDLTCLASSWTISPFWAALITLPLAGVKIIRTSDQRNWLW